LDERLDLVFGVEVLQVRSQLGGIFGLLLVGKGGILQGLLDGVQRLVVGLFAVEARLVKELAAGVVGHADQLGFAVVLAGGRGRFGLGQQSVGHAAGRALLAGRSGR